MRIPECLKATLYLYMKETGGFPCCLAAPSAPVQKKMTAEGTSALTWTPTRDVDSGMVLDDQE